MKQELKKWNIVIIADAFFISENDTLHHTDDFRLSVNNVLMTYTNLKRYFKDRDIIYSDEQNKINYKDLQKPYRQIKANGLHLYSLLTHNGFNVDLINCFDSNDIENWNILNKENLIVLISTTFLSANKVRKLVGLIKEKVNTKIVVGGTVVYQSKILYEKRNQKGFSSKEIDLYYFFRIPEIDKRVDYYIYDEHGENTLIELLKSIINDKTPYSINLIRYANEKLIMGDYVPEKFDINDYPISYENKYISTTMPIAGSYGCPFKCAFCNFSRKMFSSKSLSTLRNELQQINSLRFVEQVWFTDDNFLLTGKKLEDFCNMMIKEDFNFSWRSFIRADSISSTNVKLLKKSKINMAMIGLESGSQKVLKRMNKKTSIEDFKRTFELLAEHNIDIEISVIIGFPGETEETVTETIDLLNSIPLSTDSINYLYIFPYSLVPFSEIFENREKYKIDGLFCRWNHETMDSNNAKEMCLKVFLGTERLYMKYFDNYHGDRRKLKEIFNIRTNLMKTRILSNNALENELWSSLKTAISS